MANEFGDIFEGFKKFLSQYNLGRHDIEATLKFPRRSKQLFSKFSIIFNEKE